MSQSVIFERLNYKSDRPLFRSFSQTFFAAHLATRAAHRVSSANMSNTLDDKPRVSLLRALGPWLATAIVVGTVIGSGVFRNPQRIAAAVPDFGVVALVWLVGGLLTLLGALSLAEVAVLFPQAGGNYVFLREAYGRLFGFLWGWVEFWIIRAASIAALATLFSESLHDVLRSLQGIPSSQVYLSFWQERWLTVAIITFLVAINVQGVRWGGGLQFFVTLVKMLSLLAILLLPLFFLRQLNDPEQLASDRIGFSWSGLGVAFLAVLWPYHGWMNIAAIAGEVDRPQRNLPIAFLAGTGIILFLYVGANLAYSLVIPHDQLATLQGVTTVSAFAQRLLGPMLGAVLASSAVMISVFGALNGNILVGPRVLYAMAEDRLAPRALAHLHAVHRTPVVATLILALWSCLLVLGGALLTQSTLPVIGLGDWTLDLNLPEEKHLFDLLTDYAMFGAVVFETLAVTTIFVFRRTLPGVDRPYRCPGYPWVPLLYLVVPLYVLIEMFSRQATEAMAGLAFIGVGVAVYAAIARRAA